MKECPTNQGLPPTRLLIREDQIVGTVDGLGTKEESACMLEEIG